MAASDMADAKGLIARIEALEIRIAYQDDTIEKLNAVVTAQWGQIDALRREMSRLNERLDEASAAPGNPADERPPHY